MHTLHTINHTHSLGRKFWLVEASFQMMLAEVAMTVLITTHLSPGGGLNLSHEVVVGLLVVVCVFIAGHAWGWGPMVSRSVWSATAAVHSSSVVALDAA